jgi:hypothetical protein
MMGLARNDPTKYMEYEEYLPAEMERYEIENAVSQG